MTDPTARQIIEARLGRPWPETKDLAPDQRVALSLLGKALIDVRSEKQ